MKYGVRKPNIKKKHQGKNNRKSQTAGQKGGQSPLW